jgi:hypothetical protein
VAQTFFITGTDTGAGNLCEGFGIPAMTVSTNFFAASGVESRAFVGFSNYKLNFNIYTWEGYSEMTSQFIENWLTGHDVQTCVGVAQSSDNGTGIQMNSSAVIYGAYDLTYGVSTRPGQ